MSSSLVTKRWPLMQPLGACSLGAALVGVAHLSPGLAGAAFAGVALQAWALQPQEGEPLSRSAGLVALFISGVIGLWVGHPWQAYSPSAYWPGLLTTLAVIVAYTLVMVVPQRAPLVLAWWLGHRWPATLWLPVGWIVGEWLQGVITQMTYTDWLYSQWTIRPMLNLAAWVGGVGATWCALTVAAAMGDALARRSWRFAALGLGLGVVMWAVPAPNRPVPGWLSTIGVVHMASYLHPPQEAPPGIHLLIWPEVATGQRLYLREGPGQGVKARPPFPSKAVDHIYGLTTRVPDGLQNSVVALAADGLVLQSRAKVRLFPLLEHTVLGVGFSTFVPGTAEPVLDVHGRRVVSLLCCEALDRDFVMRASRRGVDLIAISACDKVLAQSAIANEQFLATSVLRAVETGLPLVRAALYGGAWIVAPDGRVLARAALESDGILTLAGDMPVLSAVARHARAYSPCALL